MKRMFSCWMVWAAVLVFLSACGKAATDAGDGTPVDFTVVETEKVPGELARVIEENKENEIRMSYIDGESLYLVRGYGEQKTGGYSIQVANCWENEEELWLDTRLLGPDNQEKLREEPSYPVLVIQMEMREKEIMIS